MGALANNLTLRQITMPGSHDAGVYREVTKKIGGGIFAPKSATACQDRSILEQCEAGSRFFDIRLQTSKTSIRAHHTKKILGIYHGAVGESWDNTLESVSAFLDSHPSECVILRLTKPAGGAKDQIIEKLLHSSLRGDRIFTSPVFENIASLPLQHLRGKAICVFDPTQFSMLRPDLGMHPFYKWEANADTGFITCGEYSNKKKIQEVIDGQVVKIGEHAGHNGVPHLFVLYWTQTGGSVESNTKQTPLEKLRQKGLTSGGTHHNMDYIKGLLSFGRDIKTGQAKVAVTDANGRRNVMPNVIMYDFVNGATSREIVSLNEPGLRAHLV
jgi:hypothetical protein